MCLQILFVFVLLFSKIIKNATAFISNGGHAEWAFLKFKHNEHQVETARQLSVELGFKKFSMKNTSRFLLEPKHKVVDKTGKVLVRTQQFVEELVMG